jgi:sulfur transfer complex TusBCD TusB component (DsrH family)
MRSKLRVKLQIYLLKRGVYIAIYNNRYTLSKVLFDVL